MAGVLGLDLATFSNGYCAGDGSGTPVAGAWRFRDFEEDLGALACALDDQLSALIGKFNPGLVVYEAPILVRFDKLLKIRKLYGLGMCVERLCRVKAIECCEVDLRRVKRELAGYAGAEKGDMVYAAEKLGVRLPAKKVDGREDAADAVGAWLCGMRQHDPTAWARWDQKLWMRRGTMV